MRRIVSIGIAVVLIGALAAVGLTQLQSRPQPTYGADLVSVLNSENTSGYARAVAVRDFKFPADHGAHPDFQTEWWYYTGNLAGKDGRRFGFQLTIFRRAIAPSLPQRESGWATNQIYFAHFAVTDVANNKFYHAERFARGAAGLAGAQVEPKLRVWIEDWSIEALDPEAKTVRLRAAAEGFNLDVVTQQVKSIVLQGDRGLSQKSPEKGNASYYYSMTRLPTEGKIVLGETAHDVTGNAWLDREWSTSVLGEGAVGWDWFALQLDNNREIMIYQIRKRDGSLEPLSKGMLVEADGSTTFLPLDKFKIDVLARWRSPKTGIEYPAKWRLVLQAPTGEINIEVTPMVANQELSTVTTYWEGASKITGTDGGKVVGGYGYVEMTGYSSEAVQASNNRNSR